MGGVKALSVAVVEVPEALATIWVAPRSSRGFSGRAEMPWFFPLGGINMYGTRDRGKIFFAASNFVPSKGVVGVGVGNEI